MIQKAIVEIIVFDIEILVIKTVTAEGLVLVVVYIDGDDIDIKMTSIK